MTQKAVPEVSPLRQPFVYCANCILVCDMRRRIFFYTWALLMGVGGLLAQDNLRFIDPSLAAHNFGIIAEERGKVQHTFVLRNESQKPFVITRVAVDCGCTTPQWEQDAIAPGAETRVSVTFDPLGRPGTFVKYIRVYNNLTAAPIELSIKGNVSMAGSTHTTDALYRQSIGGVQVSNSELHFPIVVAGAEYVSRFVVNNPTQEPVEVFLMGVPAYLTVSKEHFVLQPQEPEEIFVTTRVSDETPKGLLKEFIQVKVLSRSGEESIGGILSIVPSVPRFEEGKLYGRASLETYIKLKESDVNNAQRISGEIPIENEGEGTLDLFSVTSEDAALTVTEYTPSIAPGERGSIRYEIDLQHLLREKRGLQGNVTVVLNDYQAPMRKIKLVLPATSAKQ